MSQNLMDTEPGGEQTQYERDHSDIIPHKKAVGQFGSPDEGTSINAETPATNEPNTQGVTPADKVRYGQSIQEGGMGGKTTGGLGQANTEGGFGGTEAREDEPEGFAKERREQGYGGGKDMRRDVGA